MQDVDSHPRVSVSSLSSWPQSLTDDIAMWHDLGIEHVALLAQKVDPLGWGASRGVLADAHLRVSTMFGPWSPVPLDVDPGSDERAADDTLIARTLEFASNVGAPSAYLCTGSAGSLTWEQAADRFAEVVAPSVGRAAELGLRLAIEPTNTFRGDVSFVFTLRDAVDVARAAGIDVVCDLHACWFERNFEQLVRDNVDRFTLVQVSDFRRGTFDTPNRAVPGDGDVPLERLLGIILDAGYEGAFDLELVGPRIDAEGYPAAIRRGVEYTSALLERLGA